MRTYRGKGPKVLIFAVVIIMSVGFTLGLATVLTESLVIKSNLSVNAGRAPSVVFSSRSDSVVDGEVAPYSLTPTPSSTSWFKASNAVIRNGSIPTISNFQIQFEEPGNRVAYQFYAINTSDTDAYLTSIVFNNVDGESSNKYCRAITGTTNSISSICDYINLTVNVGGIAATQSTPLTDHLLAPGESELITITVTFLSSAPITADMGDFIVEFGDISLIYSDNNTGSGGDDDVSACDGDIVYISPEIIDIAVSSFETAGNYGYDITSGSASFTASGDISWYDNCSSIGVSVNIGSNIIDVYTSEEDLRNEGQITDATCEVWAESCGVKRASLTVGLAFK